MKERNPFDPKIRNGVYWEFFLVGAPAARGEVGVPAARGEVG
ncbi:MAG: hypothetical protein ACPGWR_25265 [Ardenticatenaceae bacterium]